MTARLRVLQVGCGGISAAWLDPLKEMDGVELAGLVDLDREAVAKAAVDRGGDSLYQGTDLEKALAELQPDVVFNCTVPRAHREVTLAALAHGAHVLSEKPLSDSLESALEMIDAAKAAGRLFAVMQNRRATAACRSVRRALEEGTIGEVHTVHADFFLGPHFGGFRDAMEHPLLLDMAIHGFDQARYLSGANPASVYCHEFNPEGSWYSHGASLVAIFEMTRGIHFTLRGSWCAEGLPTSWDCDWRIIGTRGTLKWDGEQQITCERVTGGSDFFREVEPVSVPLEAEVREQQGHRGMIRDFIACVRNGSRPETVAEDNIYSLAMVLAAVNSTQTGKKEQVRIHR